MAADLLIEVVYIFIIPLYGIGGRPHGRSDNTDCKQQTFTRFFGVKGGHPGEGVNGRTPLMQFERFLGRRSSHRSLRGPGTDRIPTPKV